MEEGEGAREKSAKRVVPDAVGYKDFNQAEWAFAISSANAAAGYRLTGSRSIRLIKIVEL
jgi:hypothetical protein